MYYVRWSSNNLQMTNVIRIHVFSKSLLNSFSQTFTSPSPILMALILTLCYIVKWRLTHAHTLRASPDAHTHYALHLYALVIN